MDLFDTHVHLTRDAASALLHRAQAAGVARLIAMGGAPDENQTACELSALFPEVLRAAIGYDRYRAVESDPVADLQILFNGAAGPLIRAVGEIGLDLYHAPETVSAQVALFDAMLALACSVCRPVVVHSRAADALTVEGLRRYVRQWTGPAEQVGVLHCFTGDKVFARQILDLGLYVSFSGILTFANAAALRDVAGYIPSDRLLIETDSPYLAPVPVRGRPNEPAFLPHVVRCLAAVRGLPVEEVGRITTENAIRLFGW